ncbi:DUF2971 domain-containing protein [Marinicellulosiphila megalodicopiae]|uniref:DUF2971 domain-containing protein n=1 Tax=Marinicellulosiphila megalodicopiae TaxID=2724896 RepID=UPI003BB13776
MSKLYKFRSVDTYSLSSLANSNFWFSSLNDFNDPFEGACKIDKSITEPEFKKFKTISWNEDKNINTKEKEKFLNDIQCTEDEIGTRKFLVEAAKKEMEIALDIMKSSKIFCMSQHTQNNDPIYENLMWSHYADGLRGFCMVFDREKIKSKFTYSQNQKQTFAEVKYKEKPNTFKISKLLKSSSLFGTNDFSFWMSY